MVVKIKKVILSISLIASLVSCRPTELRPIKTVETTPSINSYFSYFVFSDTGYAMKIGDGMVGKVRANLIDDLIKENPKTTICVNGYSHAVSEGKCDTRWKRVK